MSFTADIKNQLAEYKTRNRDERVAEFYGIFMMCEGRLRTLSPQVAKRCEKLCHRSEGRIVRAFYRAGERPVYGLEMRLSGDFALNDRRRAAAFLRGCFLIGGYVSEPDSPSHVELSFRSVTAYELGLAAFELCSIVPKGTIRGSHYVLYLKDSAQVSALLVTLGAIRGVLEYENIRIAREGRRTGNRVLNCDDANINKALSAGANQVKMINALSSRSEFLELPEGVREAARLRLENPELSLTELGELCVPPVSKAGLAHRFKKIEELYRRVVKEN